MAWQRVSVSRAVGSHCKGRMKSDWVPKVLHLPLRTTVLPQESLWDDWRSRWTKCWEANPQTVLLRLVYASSRVLPGLQLLSALSKQRSLCRLDGYILPWVQLVVWKQQLLSLLPSLHLNLERTSFLVFLWVALPDDTHFIAVQSS